MISTERQLALEIQSKSCEIEWKETRKVTFLKKAYTSRYLNFTYVNIFIYFLFLSKPE